MPNCSKRAYPNAWAAARALRAIRLKLTGRAGRLPVGIYPCPTCKFWHLTSHRTRERSKRQAEAADPGCPEATLPPIPSLEAATGLGVKQWAVAAAYAADGWSLTPDDLFMAAQATEPDEEPIDWRPWFEGPMVGHRLHIAYHMQRAERYRNSKAAGSAHRHTSMLGMCGHAACTDHGSNCLRHAMFVAGS